MHVRLQEAESLQARVDAVRRAIWARNDTLTDQNMVWDVMDVLDQFVVVRQGRELLKVPYSFDDEGIAQFGEPEAVEMELEPVQMASLGEPRLMEADEKEGWTWEVDIIEPGWSLNGFYYTTEVLAEAAPLFEGVKVYAFPETGLFHHKDPLKKNFDRQIGWVENVRVGEAGQLVATLHFLKARLADQIRTKLTEAWRHGRRRVLGLSIDARSWVIPFTTDAGKKGNYVAKITEALSLDAVLKPAAGGKFTQLVAGEATNTQESPMKKRLWKLLQARRPDALDGLDENTVTLEQLMEAAGIGDSELEAFFQEEEEKPAKPAEGQPASTQEADQRAEAAARRTEVIDTRLRVNVMVQESKLPELAQKRLRKRFAEQVASDAQIQEAIDEEREYLAGLAPARPGGVGGERAGAGISVGAEKLERLQAGFDRSFGLEPENEALKTIAPIGLRRLYDEITGGEDPDVRGVIHEALEQAMTQEAFTNATLPRVVANTLHRRLLRDYRELNYRERDLVSVTSAADFRTREAIRVGYFSDLPDVDPESGDYAEIAAYSDGGETYSVGQKGGLVTITRKHIINDDVGAVAKVTGRLGRAARRTFAKFVYAFFTDNPLMGDGVAWFAAGHNNLGSAALSVGELTAARLALFNQTEPDSGEKLGLDLYYLLVPIDLEDTAININQTNKVPGSANNDSNRWFHFFGENNERIIVVPFFADANDWIVTANPMDVDLIEVAFLQGQEEPELWLADQPTVGQMFVADKIQYKIRHEYGGAPVDHRGARKAVVV